jgi:hypothetical protein
MQPVLALAVLATFGAALAIAFLSDDKTLLTAMLGSTVPLASQVVAFYFGSSEGSRRKDETIAIAARSNSEPQPPPVAIAVNNPQEKPQ